MSEWMIETRSLTKRFEKVTAVDGLDLHIESGSVHGLIGPNGAGKSTTLKLISGALRCTSGEGFIKGNLFGSVAANGLLGFSPERPSFYREMSAQDYLVHMGSLSGLCLSEAEKRAWELLEWLEISEAAERQTGGFSAGMKQRLSIAQALIHRPELLVLDEPTANLDPGGRISLLEKLKALAVDGMTILISSHILSELEYMVDNVTFLDEGRLVSQDTMQHLKEDVAGGSYILDTSDNAAVIAVLREDPNLGEAWQDEGGVIHVISRDALAFQALLMQTLSEKRLMLKRFGPEGVTLADVYMKNINAGRGRQG